MPRHAAPTPEHRRLTLAVVGAVTLLSLGGAWATGTEDEPAPAVAFDHGDPIGATDAVGATDDDEAEAAEAAE
ncbi:MAG: hypothetical protein H0V33_06645, partial [Acidimicrobiia bacterium]|nr:hypothetical protein [Acidimicrobiia bacterium]